jgi:von Willebrand factor type A domain
MRLRVWTTTTALLTFSIVSAIACSSDDDGGNDVPGEGGPIFDDGTGPDFGDDPEEGSFNGDRACAGQTAGVETTPAVLQLVVDTSGSMNQGAPGTRSSKWIVTRRAMLDAIDEMPASTSIGVVFYPDASIDEIPRCFDEEADVAIQQLEGDRSPQRQRIQRAFETQSPDGGTPTHDAYRYAFDQLAASDAVGSRFVVVITDGTPTFSLGCVGTGLIEDPVDPTPLVGEASRSLERGVKTFVIGSPGSEGARESLSRMAEAGGTAAAGCSHQGPNYCHFDMTEEQDFATALTRALGTISGLALSCSYDIPQPGGGQVLDPAKVNVLFTPPGAATELIAQNAGGTCNEGWQYSENGSRVELCGSTCDRVRSSDGSLTLEFGCTTEVR